MVSSLAAITVRKPSHLASFPNTFQASVFALIIAHNRNTLRLEKSHSHISTSMPEHSTNTTRFLVMSDAHSFDIDDPATDSHPLSLPHLPSRCCSIVVISHHPSKKALQMLGSFDAALRLVIAGIHSLELQPTGKLSA